MIKATRELIANIVTSILGGAAIVVLGVFAYTSLLAGKTIHQLLGENKVLRESIANLTAEETVGYAKVVSQETREGKLFTKIRFIEMDRHDETRRVLEKEYEVEGDVVHFDALIVKFGQEYVADGRERALFLWRRIYGEKMTPEQGYPIETPGGASPRYAELTAKLPIREREMFWNEVWRLAENPDRLREAGVQAIYGNGIYTRVRPGFIYIFKIDATGTFYPERVPDV